MAHPGFVIEQYVYHFLCQWHVGLQPSLTLNAKSNGEIDVSLNLTTSLQSYHDVEQCSTTLSNRRSGRESRKRRRRQRAAAQSFNKFPEACKSSDVGSEEDKCSAIETLPTDPPDLTDLAIECHPPPTSQIYHVSDYQEANDEADGIIDGVAAKAISPKR